MRIGRADKRHKQMDTQAGKSSEIYVPNFFTNLRKSIEYRNRTRTVNKQNEAELRILT